MKQLEFDEAEHRYFLVDGEKRQEIPGVTSILKECGIIDGKWHNDLARDRGTRVHEALELVNKGILEVDDFEGKDSHPYLVAHKAFLESSGWKVEFAETRVYHPGFLYGGTTDVVFVTPEGKRILTDYKTGSPEPWHALQVVGYREAFIFNLKTKIDGVAVLYLGKDGKFKLKQKTKHNGRETDMGAPVFKEIWLGVVRVWVWRNRNSAGKDRAKA